MIYGVGKYAEYAQYVFENDSEYTVKAFCMEKEYRNSNSWNGKPLVEFEELQKKFPAKSHSLFIAVGNNEIRKRNFETARKMGYSLASYISTKASYWENLVCGENVFIDEGTTLQPFVTVKENSILFACNIGHHTTIGAHCLISVSTTGGNVQIGDLTSVGMNSVIKQNLILGKKNIIGMGCVIEQDTPQGAVFSNKGTKKRSITYEQVANRFLK